MSNTSKLENYIKSMMPMPDEKARDFAERFESIELEKSDFLIKEGQISKHTFFLEEGYIRTMTIDKEGQEITTELFSAPCMVNDFLSFFKHIPTEEGFQALTNCKIWRIDFDGIQVLFHNYPKFREFGRMMLVENYHNLHTRTIGMIKETAEQRYLKLINEYPDIFQNISLKIIASYLGITDTSLSRIRKEIAKTNRHSRNSS